MDLIALILRTAHHMTAAVHRGLAAGGFPDLRPAHGFAFQLIASTGGVTGVELGEHLGVSRQAAGQMVDELERAGYVARRPDPRDGRQRLIVLTGRGRDAIALSVRLWAEQERAWEDRIGPDGLGAVREGLRAYVLAHEDPDAPIRLRPTW